ncbi:isocitrate lyase/phosphoenolpyruvate mutase family protein [Streptosporangium roseum]|uniref:isocitrate lyase/phosphoenolpyruvate mutase family protein n=1 Tax=Streptosporangium roseum TaxID=2001 RepID=UPI003322AEEA
MDTGHAHRGRPRGGHRHPPLSGAPDPGHRTCALAAHPLVDHLHRSGLRPKRAEVVGLNLEDSLRAGPALLRPILEQSERIAAARSAADTAGVPLFINTRIDTHRLPTGDLAVWLKETLARAEAYVAAGADGVFVLGALDAETITALVRAVSVPVNVLAGPGTLTVPALAALGVARVSAGSSIAEAAYGLAARAARELLTDGTCGALEGGLEYGTLNSLLLAEPGR